MSGAAQTFTDPAPLGTVARIGGRPESRVFALPPQPLTSFVGRERELGAVGDLLRSESVRLLTLTGPGGVGKSRLAMRLAEDLASEFDNGVAFVSLAAIANPDLVVGAIVQALGEREVTGQSRFDRLCLLLRQRHLLLVLDNFEQVVAAAPAVARLLAECAGVKALVTSRVRLQVSGEQEYVLAPLGVPVAAFTSIDDLEANPSVTLFVQRARSVRPTFALERENADAVAAVCRQLDGLPLAIELAAARSKVLAPNALRARLEHGLDLLSGGPRDQPERLQTLRAAIAWSYDLLSLEDRQVFRRLAVFAGGFTFDAAEAVAGMSDGRWQPNDRDSSVLDSISALVDSSLLREVEGLGGEPRFGMLETIREFGLELLASSDEEEMVRAAHAAWFVTLAETGVGNTTLPPAGWLALMESEHPNLRAALGRYVAHGDSTAAMRLAGALWQFWHFRGHSREGTSWLDQVLALPGDEADEFRTPVLFGSGVLAWARGDLDRARARHEEGLALARARSDPNAQGRALYGIAEVARLQARFDEAAAAHLEARELFRETGDLSWTMITLIGQAHVYHRQGDLDGALTRTNEAVAIARQIDNSMGVATALIVAAMVAHDRGEFAAGARHWAESLATSVEYRDWRATGQIAAGVAAIAVACGEYEPAARLFGASDAVRTTVGGTISTLRDWYLPRLEEARATLGAEAFARAWDSGQMLSVEDAARETALVAERLQRDDRPARADTAARSPSNQSKFGLSSRELEVLSLLVAGQTDREIGATLFISPRTAQGHVAHLLDKLGVSTRTAAVTIALQNALVEPEAAE